MYFRTSVLILFTAMILSGCGQIQGMSLPYVPSPKAVVQTPSSPSEGDIAITLKIIDRELENADIILSYSTDNGQSFSTATLTVPSEALNLATAWSPGQTHTITWDSVADAIALSGNESVVLKITPSDASNPSGTEGYTGTFTVNNTTYNTPPTATLSTPAGTMAGNIPINYFLSDAESNVCSISVLYSTNDGTSWLAATMGSAGDGLSNLTSSQSGTAHMYLWNSIADGIGLSALVSTVRIRITPTDSFNTGTYDDTNSFSVDNSVPNVPPTVTITSGPADSSTVSTSQVTYEWTGDDTDGSVTGYYYSFDHDPPDTWTTNTSVGSGTLSEGSHTFRIVSVDDQYELSDVESRTFTVLTYVIDADLSASPTSGLAPLSVFFTDETTANFDVDTWSWDFGDGGSSTEKNPTYVYDSAGTYTVSLTSSGTFGSDTETKTDYISVTTDSSTPNATELECFNLINIERQLVGRAPYTWCEGLYNHSKGHACDMCDRGYFAHVNPEGEYPTDRGQLGHAGSYTFPSIVPSPYNQIGEVLAMNFVSAEEVVAEWMNSSGHSTIILSSSYTHAGAGICNGCFTHWVVSFGTQ